MSGWREQSSGRHTGGGQGAAIAFSLIETARLDDVEPWAYLRDVLGRIAGHRQDRLEALLPMHWGQA